VAKYLAIASLEDLEKIFGLPEDAAKTIAHISDDSRPRSLEGYRQIITATAYEALQKRVHGLTGAEFARVRQDAVLVGKSIDKLEW
jgi:hypothetical protein